MSGPFGVSRQTWLRYDAYAIRDGGAVHGGAAIEYSPVDYPDLPFELAKVNRGSEALVTKFYHRWGVLVVENEPPQIVWDHAAAMKFVLALYNAIQNDDQPQMRSLADKFYAMEESPGTFGIKPTGLMGMVIVAHRALSLFVKESDLATLGSKRPEEDIFKLYQEEVTRMGRPLRDEEIRSFLNNKLDVPPESEARIIVADIIGNNVRSLHPRVAITNNGKFELQMQWKYLADVAWSHLLFHVTNTSDVSVCDECHQFFRKTDRRQRFCPPLHLRGSLGKVESACGASNRKRRQTMRSNSARKAGTHARSHHSAVKR